MFSILILTYNEERFLPACLERIAWCDDIVVVDSFSTDRTVEIATGANCRVYQRKFDDFAGQRNFGLHEVDYKHQWVFHLDADEHFTAELRAECEQKVAENTIGAFLVPAKMMLWGRWLKHAATYPVYQMRFHRLNAARFEQFGHGQREYGLTAGLGTLKEPYEHNAFCKGLSDWFQKHNRYSSQEAAETCQRAKEPVSFQKIFTGSALERRRNLKLLSYKLPGRAVLRFFYMYFIKRGFIDGRPGLTYCLLHCIYEQTIAIKVSEIKYEQSKGEGKE